MMLGKRLKDGSEDVVMAEVLRSREAEEESGSIFEVQIPYTVPVLESP